MNTLPILLDTDIGSDIDDAVALAYLLRQPRCELLGVTTVSGESEKRAALADAVCRAGGRDDIPVHVGTDLPLLIAPLQPHAPQAEALASGRWPHRTFEADNTAINFLRQTIRARPGEITLLTIGPLTNVALLFARDPEIPSLLKGLMMMGGWFFDRPQPEWNIRCDPHAAAMVFAAPVPHLTAVGIDVTQRCRLPADECRRRFAQAGGPLAPVAAFAEVWFRHAPEITFHDPLAAALLFEPSLCQLEEHRVAVELVSPHRLGQTFPEWRDRHGGQDTPAAPPHRLAASVDAEAFFRHFFEVVGG
ncbi:MAG: nucleoside hydrolase [Armatimonadetes bacterium]|nr:nucleoside hydrolase [Armatimonadota bacterium]